MSKIKHITIREHKNEDGFMMFDIEKETGELCTVTIDKQKKINCHHADRELINFCEVAAREIFNFKKQYNEQQPKQQ